MKKFTCCKRIQLLLVLLLSICFIIDSYGQQYTYTTTTTTSNSIPLGNSSNRRQNIYYPSDFSTAPAGMITKIYYLAGSGTSFGFTNLTIQIGYTSLSTFTAGPWATGLTTCYTGSGTFNTNSNGWIEIPLQTPFFYNASQNFIIDVSLGSYTTGMSAICESSAAALDRTLYGTSSATTASLQQRLMRLGFDLTPGTPCSAPTNLTASGITGSGATLTWTAVTSSQGYEYVLDQVSGNPSGSGTPTSLTSYSASGLNLNTTYYMHVRNKCSSTSFSSWVTTPFTTLNVVSCNSPAIVTAINMTSSSATINWSAVTGSQGYEYKIDQVATSPTSGLTSTTANSIGVTGLTGGTGYYAHVRNVCQATDKSAWVNYPFTTPTCNKPLNVLFSNITDNSADVLWSLMSNANKYEYVVDFSNLDPTSGYQVTTGITTHLSGLSPNSKYYVHVRSRCFTVDSSDWRLDSFITQMVCYAPAVQVNYLGTNTPYAYWAAIPTAIAYEYALTHTPATPAFGKEIYNTFIDLTLADDGKDYYLHVRAKCNSQFTVSQWSTVALRTGTTGISPANNNDHEANMYPNPANDVLHITGIKGNYVVSDATGHILLRGTTDLKEWQINIEHLVPGIYMLQVRNENTEQKFRFTKQ